MSIAIAVAIGFISGILAGMLGVGGGVIIIPGLVLLLGAGQHTAQGISLGVIVFTGIAGTITHFRNHNVDFKTALWVTPSALIFALLGAYLASVLDSSILRRLFALLIIFLGARLILGR